MSRLFMAVLAVLLSAQVASAQVASAQVAETPKLESTKDKISYHIGFNIGSNLSQQGLDVNFQWLTTGISEALAKSDHRLGQEEIEALVQKFEEQLQAEAAKAAAANKQKGEQYLVDNAKKEGVVTLESGLQYKVINSGSGATPTAADTVKTHYRGTLIDGTEFDSSYKRGEPATFPVARVIRGWTEALQKMKVGDKWMLYIPSGLAYGPQGSPPVIGPDSTLVFEIELLEIVK